MPSAALVNTDYWRARESTHTR